MRKKMILSLVTFFFGAIFVMAANHRFTLVIDAGHGGKDHGAPGAISQEKDLTLKYALAFGRMVERNCPDVKVVYTRKSDVYVTLAGRAEIANRNKADLFVSVHINALDQGRVGHGYQTYTLGRSLRNGNTTGVNENLEVAKRENAVIYLEKNYQQTYKGFDPNSPESNIMFEFIQDKNREQSVEMAKYLQSNVCQATGRVNGGVMQDNLAVLRLTSMSACLMELGFISTPDEEQFLNSDDALEEYTRGFYNAFIQYKNKHDDNLAVPYKPVERAEVDVPSVVPEEYKTTSKDTPAVQPVVSTPAPSKDSRDNDRRSVQEKDTDENRPATTAAPVSRINNAKPVFKIQLLVSNRKLREGDSHFKGLSEVDYYEENGSFKYTYGASNNYNEIYRLRKQILDKFPDAFIIAFKGNDKMDVNEAIREFKQGR
jgi:N-acetylmuramoyl-L-alanine amidase